MEVTPSHHIILPFLQLDSLRGRMTNISSWSSSDHDIRCCADLWIARRRTGIVEAQIGRHSSFIINFTKGRYILCGHPCVFCESIIEAINIDTFRESPDADKLVAVVPLNPIAKHFPTISHCYPHSDISTQPYPTTFRHT